MSRTSTKIRACRREIDHAGDALIDCTARTANGRLTAAPEPAMAARTPS